MFPQAHTWVTPSCHELGFTGLVPLRNCTADILAYSRSLQRIHIIHANQSPTNQWPLQVPKSEVPTIYKAYVRSYVRGYTAKIWLYMVQSQYLHFRILEFPLNEWQGVSDVVRHEMELTIRIRKTFTNFSKKSGVK